jgi:hypothetical protein
MEKGEARILYSDGELLLGNVCSVYLVRLNNKFAGRLSP